MTVNRDMGVGHHQKENGQVKKIVGERKKSSIGTFSTQRRGGGGKRSCDFRVNKKK